MTGAVRRRGGPEFEPPRDPASETATRAPEEKAPKDKAPADTVSPATERPNPFLAAARVAGVDVERRALLRQAIDRASTEQVRSRLQASVAPTSLMTERLRDGDANCLEHAATMARPGRDEIVFMDDRRAADDGNANGAGHVLVRDRASGRVWDPNDGPAPVNPKAWPYASVAAWTAARGPAADRGPAYEVAGAVRAETVQDVLTTPPDGRAARIAELGDPVLSAVADRLYADEGTDPVAQRRALDAVRTALDDSGIFGRVTESELRTATEAISGLQGPDAAAVIQQLEREGLLEKMADRLERRGAGAVATAFGRAMGQTVDGTTLATLAESMRGAGEATRAAFMDGANATAPVETRLSFASALAGRTTDGTPSPHEFSGGFGYATSTSFAADGDAVSVASAIASLRGEDVATAFGRLSDEERAAVLDGAANLRTSRLSSGYGGGADFHEPDRAGFGGMMDAIASIPDPETRARYLNEGLEALGRLEEAGVHGFRRAELAERALRHLDSDTLRRIEPDAMAALASGLSGRREGPVEALRTIDGLEPSPAREALVRTLFLKTPEGAYRESPELAGAFARALAAGQGDAEPSVVAARTRALELNLSTDRGRALLVDDDIPGASRIWAARELMNGNEAVAAAAGARRPWEHPGLLESHARARFSQFEHRGDRAVPVSGSNIENLVGAGLGMPMRDDLPADEAGLASVQARALDGQYNYFEGNEAVERVAGGIRVAQERMGGGDISVATLPIQFSSQRTGPIDLQIYRVEGQNGQTRFVDNTGRVYDDFEAWRRHNQLPPGRMTFPAGGHLGEPGETRMVTENTPDVSDTFWEHVGDVADVAALVGGVVASGVIIAGSGGTATPLVAGAWGVALGSAGYMGIKAGNELFDRHQHGQTLSLSDPDARAAWLSLGGAGLTVLGAGVAQGAGALAANGSRVAPNVARAAGILNASANFADAAASVDQAHNLIANWDELSPGQRAQLGLSIAFWGGMTGVSARASGGRASDAFSFSAQMNRALIESGAAVRANPDMAPGHVRVETGYTQGGHLDLRVQYGPGTSQTSIDIHRQVAHGLIDNTGVQGALRRGFGLNHGFRPGTRGEEVALEVAKHRALVRAYDERLPGAAAGERVTLRAERDAYAAELARYEVTLRHLRANPALAGAPGRGYVDAAPEVGERLLDRLLERVYTRAETSFPRAGNYHADTRHQMPDEVVRLILREPDAIYRSQGGSGRLIYLRGGDIAVVEGPGSGGGNVITAYGPSGIKGESGVAALGGAPIDPGPAITAEMLVNGTIPSGQGTQTLPPADLIWSR